MECCVFALQLFSFMISLIQMYNVARFCSHLFDLCFFFNKTTVLV